MTKHRAPATALGVWLLGAVIFAGFGGLRVFPPPFPQVLLIALLAALIVAYALRPSFRRWVDTLPPRWILALHLTRFVGVYFLVLHGRGELPYAFAVVGGWGDILVATLALVLLGVYRRGPSIASLPLHAWNLLGLGDILFVVGTAGRLAAESPQSMTPLTELPLGLLPTFLVPLILFSHGSLLLRGLRSWARPRVDREH